MNKEQNPELWVRAPTNEDVRENWQDTEGNAAPYFDSNGIWTLCLITIEEKTSRTS